MQTQFALVINTLGLCKLDYKRVTHAPPSHSIRGRESERLGDPPSHPRVSCA